MTCRKCRWLAVPLNAAGARRVLKNRVYACEFDVKRVALPHCVTMHYSASLSWDGKFTIAYRSMLPDDGAGCPTFEPRK